MHPKWPPKAPALETWPACRTSSPAAHDDTPGAPRASFLFNTQGWGPQAVAVTHKRPGGGVVSPWARSSDELVSGISESPAHGHPGQLQSKGTPESRVTARWSLGSHQEQSHHLVLQTPPAARPKGTEISTSDISVHGFHCSTGPSSQDVGPVQVSTHRHTHR